MKSLFDTVVVYCHEQYISSYCEGCNHPVTCPGNPCKNCKQCLEEVHYPSRYPNGRKDYECDRMMYFYVCDYTEKYASEMLYLMRKSTALAEIEDYHVLSIGCGACPDLMALERYCSESSSSKQIRYWGIDVNERWKNIHNTISLYRSSSIINVQFDCIDAVEKDFTVLDANVVILQYIISHFYNNGQIAKINNFFQKLVNAIVCHKQKDVPMVILINDVNSNNRGRDFFADLVGNLQDADFHGNCRGYYFNYRIVNQAQMYGLKHSSNETIFKMPNEFEDIYHPWHICSSAQLLIEVR